MDNILAYLEKLTYPEDLPQEYFSLIKCQDPYLDFLDELTYAQSEGIKWERQEAFSRGFRLGARLMLALAPPSAPDTHHRS